MIIYERMKTAALIFLVILSVFLTWRLWTFQPDYALLGGTEYVAPVPLSEEKPIETILFPEQIVLHGQDEKWFIPKNHELYTEVYKKMTTASYDLGFQPSFRQSTIVKINAAEIILPTKIPSDIVKTILNIKDEFMILPKNIDRFIMFAQEDESAVYVQLISYEEQKIVNIKSNITVNDFQELFTEELPSASVFPLIEQDDRNLVPIYYIPDEELVYPSKSYTSTVLPGSYFKELFFSEPSTVRYYRQGSGEESYTDGNRLLQIVDNGKYMDFMNPVYSDKVERGNKHIVISSLEYLNGHGGWTDSFMLDSWNDATVKEEVYYRMVLDGVPVMKMEGTDMMMMLERTGTQISRYVRPLFDLDRFPFDSKGHVLLSGKQLLALLEENELDMNRIERVTVGYEMKKVNSIVTVEPSWFMLYRGIWQKVPEQKKREGETHGLE